MKQPLIALFGPTACGKSDLSLRIAEHLNADIVNMDSAQCYTPLTIGTAKPIISSLSIPHHLFDSISTPETMTVVSYRAHVHALYNQLSEEKKRMVLVGGSGFYLKSLLFPPSLDAQKQQDDTLHEQDDPPGDISWQYLHDIDPDRAAQIKPNDLYRIARALEIWNTHAIKPSLLKPVYNPIAPYHIIFVTRDRTELYDRINARVVGMIEQGFIDEVASLLDTPWEEFLLKKKFIGYNELIDYLRGSRTTQSLQAALTRIQKRSRNYAKRQETFWRMLKNDLLAVVAHNSTPQIPFFTELNLTHFGDDLYIKELVKRISQF